MSVSTLQTVQLDVDLDAPLECTSPAICHIHYAHAAAVRARGECACGTSAELWCAKALRVAMLNGVVCDAYLHFTHWGDLVVEVRNL